MITRLSFLQTMYIIQFLLYAYLVTTIFVISFNSLYFRCDLVDGRVVREELLLQSRSTWLSLPPRKSHKKPGLGPSKLKETSIGKVSLKVCYPVLMLLTNRIRYCEFYPKHPIQINKSDIIKHVSKLNYTNTHGRGWILIINVYIRCHELSF